ncbi:MAG: GAF domain-containing protein [Planctomycetes bacterium]|nr:GAF domain-containing protein [Planctomycetota bacterium]
METTQKFTRYQRLIAQLKDLFTATTDPVSRMATATALLYHKMGYFYWVGFYRLVDGDLLVGPYQGTLACQKLKQNTGVCWKAFNQNQTIVVPDVHQFPGHIACDPKSQSEIVVPIHDTKNAIIAVLDADSDKLNTFDAIDAHYLDLVASMIYTG